MTGGSMSRRKGARGEIALRDLARNNGFPHVERRQTGPYAQQDADDLVGLPEEYAEVRVRARVEIVAWMQETEKKAAEQGLHPAVYWRVSSRAKSTQFYVCTPAVRHFDLLRRAA